MCPGATRQRGNSVQLGRESRFNNPANTAVLVITNPRIPVESQIADESRAVKSEKLVAVGNAALVPPPASAVSRRLQLDQLSVLLEPRQDFAAVVDLQDPVNFGGFSRIGPTGFEYDLDDVFARVSVMEL